MGAGRQVTDAQVKEVRVHLDQGASLRKSAMKAGMDRKTARKYRDLGQLPSEARTPHTWRTRPDPLAEVWPSLTELLEREPGLQAKTLVAWLLRERPGQDWRQQRRTVERRVRQWKAQHGPAKEIFFSQVHEPGRLGSSDFTHMDELGIRIAGQPFGHMVYHFVLTHSNWEHVTLCFSESFASLSEGLQNALGELGGVPARHRTDRMTLAVHHDGNAERYTARYRALLGHYGVVPEATNAYSGHENGDCEQGHRRFKEALAQELMVRGSRDFACREDYWVFVRALVSRRNRDRVEKFARERACLGSLPAGRLETAERQRSRVSQGSTIQVKKNAYSVPARLIGEWVESRIGAERIEVWYAGGLVQTMERLRGETKHRINYRHVIDWLVRKPGAFARYVYREDLYPTVTFRRAYDALVEQRGAGADKEYLRILQAAALEGEACVEAALAKLLGQRQPLSEQAVRTLLGSATPLTVAAQVSVPAVDLRMYDALLEGASHPVSDAVSDAVSDERSDSGLSFEELSALVPLNQERNEEVDDEPGRDGGVDALPAGTTLGNGAEPVRGGGPAGDGGVVEPCGVPAGTAGTRVPAASAQPHRTAAQGVEVGAGEELVGVGPEASAAEGGATIAGPVERGVSGPVRERPDVRSAGLGEVARVECGVVGVGACGPADAVHQVQPAGARVAEGEARFGVAWLVAAIIALGGLGDRRPGLCATEPGGDGGAVHALGGALRAWQRAGDEQPGVLALGADLQGPDDDGGGHRSAGASQRDRGVERVELSGGVGEANAYCSAAEGGVIVGGVWPAGEGAWLRCVRRRYAPSHSAAPGPLPGTVCRGCAGKVNCR